MVWSLSSALQTLILLLPSLRVDLSFHSSANYSILSPTNHFHSLNRQPAFHQNNTIKMHISTLIVAVFAAAASARISARQNNAAAADFGQCDPSISFELGREGRKANEGTFLPIDPLVAQGQQDALNPNIITNRVCDQLTNVCEANQAAKDLCADAQDLVAGLGTKDASTAEAFNSALGF